MIRAWWLLAVAAAAQSEEVTDAKLVVDFSAERTEDAWIAAAFKENAERDLASHHVTFVDAKTIDTSRCTTKNAKCLVDVYAAAGIDIILLGWIGKSTLRFEAYEGWLRTRVARDSIRLDKGPNLLILRDRTLKAVSPFFETGGLLAKKRMVPRESDDLPLSPGMMTLLALLCGCIWSWFLLINLRMAIPAIPGLGGIRHGNVGRMLEAWSSSAFMRLLLIALVQAPFVIAVIFGARALGVTPRTTWMLLVPLWGLVLYASLLALVDRLAIYIDRKLVVGKAAAENPWHPVIKKYFLGYVRRAGLQLDRAVIDKTLFLPGRNQAIAVYGGGLQGARIVINESLLELALHPLHDEQLFDEESDPKQRLDLGDARGLLVPNEEGTLPKESARDAKKSAKLARPGQRPLLGQNETLLGYVLPTPADESAPLVIDDRDDYSVLRHLLTAHYAAFDHGRYGEEADDTDPTQKDFLFGALLREIGAVERRDPVLLTLTLSLELLLGKAPKWMRAVHLAFVSMHERLFAKSPELIADGYAALNRGLHHLIQYLDYLRTKNDAQLTARADEPKLHSTSAEILRRALEAGDERLVQLGRHLDTELPVRSRRIKVLIYSTVALAIALAAANAVRASIAYAPVYEKRMQDVEQQIEKGASSDGQ